MDNEFFNTEVNEALGYLREGKIILYPTDTIWGLGCDASNIEAIKKIYLIKNREDSKSLIILVADERDILQYVAAPDLALFDYLNEQDRPTTVIYENAINLPEQLIATDGTIAIRIVKDEFCRHLIRRLKKPIVSTSANISGTPSPYTFVDVAEQIKNQVDHIVQWHQDHMIPAQPSRIIKWVNGQEVVIRN